MATSELAGRLQAAVIAAMKAKDKDRLGVLRMMQAAIKQVEVDTRKELADADVQKVLASYAKKVKDTLASTAGTDRADLKAAAEAELAIVGEFLPAEIGDEELEKLVRQAIAESGAQSPADMGKVMKVAVPLVAGKADGARVSAMVKALLAGAK
ncbi:GatB/YqeY domain-containing protein [bacterium]|nr:GatB/YqeY domain-containing protein [bacterium]